MYKVIGKASYSGEFQGYNFSKVRLFLQCDPNPKWNAFEGVAVEIVNIPDSDTARSVKIGDIVDIRYNRYGKPDSVDILRKE